MARNFANKLAAIALTAVMSATCVIAAVGPGTAGGAHAVVTSARLVA